MIEIITDLPDYVAGFTATGEVSKSDYESVLIPVLEEKLKEHGHIHFLLVLDTDVSQFTLGAWWSDAAIGIKHLTKWKKMAIVSDEQVVEKFTNVFSALVPGESKGFRMDELEDAKRWVAAEVDAAVNQ